jgi:hypothetical protein
MIGKRNEVRPFYVSTIERLPDGIILEWAQSSPVGF